MAKLPGAFNSEDHDDMGTFTLLPKGKYNAVIHETDYRENKKQNGHFLEIKFTINEGEFVGSELRSYLNLDNPSAVAVDLANKELATICRAVGKVAIEDSEELHGHELTLDVDIDPGKGDNPDRNKISFYLPLEGAAKPGKTEKVKPAVKRKPIFEDDDD